MYVYMYSKYISIPLIVSILISYMQISLPKLVLVKRTQLDDFSPSIDDRPTIHRSRENCGQLHFTINAIQDACATRSINFCLVANRYRTRSTPIRRADDILMNALARMPTICSIVNVYIGKPTRIHPPTTSNHPIRKCVYTWIYMKVYGYLDTCICTYIEPKLKRGPAIMVLL